MARRIIEYRGNISASCAKCGNVVEIDPNKFKQGSPCPAVRIVPPRPGVEEEEASVPCGGVLVYDPVAKIWNGKRYDFEPKDEVLGVPCGGRRVCVVEDIAPDDNGVAYFDGLHGSERNGFFWATDLEQALNDGEVLGVISRNPDILLKFVEDYRDEVREVLGLKPGRKKGDDE